MKIKLVRLFILIVAVMGLSACSGVSAYMANFPAMMGIEGVTAAGTGKTIGDHMASFATGKNCSTVRKNTGRHYCDRFIATILLVTSLVTRSQDLMGGLRSISVKYLIAWVWFVSCFR